jgi:hypothetical protein
MTLGLNWLNAACDWADYRDVPINVWRDEDGDWCVSLTFKDAAGVFRSEPLKMPEKVQTKTIEMLDGKLERLCAATRRERIGLTRMVQLNGA